MLAPINQLPPEVLTLISDFWNEDVRDRAMIALAHVCRALREIFISQTSLWTDFYCEDMDKTHVSLDCSGPSPVNAWLERYQGTPPHDPPLHVIPHAIAQLKSMVIHGYPENIQEVTTQLSHPAPLLESLRIEVNGWPLMGDGPLIATTLFNGDFPSLHDLYLQGVRTELPWRNMVNLTSFTLVDTSGSETSVMQLLDFFERAPRLRKIRLHFAIPNLDAHSGRPVSLPCLKRMEIVGNKPLALLFDHLSVPVNAKLTAEVDPRYSSYLPSSLENIRNLTGFRVHMHVREFYPSIRFTGPAGETSIAPATRRATTTCQVLESLTQFDYSKTERLRLVGGDLLLRDGCALYWVIFAMKGLRTITISRCKNPSKIFGWLDEIDVCPKLEELVVDVRADGEKLDIQRLIRMAATRATMLVKLKSVRIASRDKFVQTCALKLKEYIPHVECSPRVALVSDTIDSSDEED